MKEFARKSTALLLAIVLFATFSFMQGAEIYAFAADGDTAVTEESQEGTQPQTDPQTEPAGEVSGDPGNGTEGEGEGGTEVTEPTEEPAPEIDVNKNGWKTEDGHKLYYVKGIPATGYKKIGKKYYGFDENGYMLTGYVTINGKPYAFDKKGVGLSKGWKSSNKYYCNGNGVLKVGYSKLKQGKKKYYFFFNRTTGKAMKGYVFDEKYQKPYYFNSKYRGISKGWKTTSKGKCYSTGSGKLAVGYKKIGKKYYGFGTDGFTLSGEQKIGSKLYLFKTDGSGSDAKWFDDGTKYCKGKGVVALGYAVIGGEGYFFETDASSEDFGRMVQDQERKYNGQLYRIGPDGKGIEAGWSDENTRYCLGKGKMAVGYAKAPDPETGEVYYWYFNKDTGSEAFATFITGYVKEGSNHYMFNDQGHGLSQGWLDLNDGRAYSTGGGKLKTGWLALGKRCYYLNKSTALWVKEGKVGNIVLPADGYLTNEAYILGIKTLDKIGWSLKAAYKFSYKLKYYDRWYRKNTVEKYALRGFKDHHGNCYVMASTFTIMARLLGYNIKQVRGHVGAAPHSWTEIKNSKGKWRVYDPNFRNETGRNGWNIYYGKKGTWRYKKSSTVKMSYK